MNLAANTQAKRIVIVGGGAAGLELATLLGNDLGRKNLAEIVLIDVNLTHIWKPLWHELAVGTLSSNEDEVNYISYAYNHYFNFQLGTFIGLDRASKTIRLSIVMDSLGNQILPERNLNYDVLVIAIGSLSNDFAIPGVKEYCHFLDSYEDCQRLHYLILGHLLKIQEQVQPDFSVVIIGGGATGVELASELQFACIEALQYKQLELNKFESIKITVIEGAPRLLSTLPEKISRSIHQELNERGIMVLTNEKVKKVDEHFVYTDKLCIKADLKLWAAGIKAPEVLKNLGLQTNKLGQLLVKPSLQTVEDDCIFALGDCASCPQPGTEQTVPPRAQAAHQQAALLAKSLKRYLNGKSPLTYIYHDYGSLITLSKSNTVGQLMGSLGSVTIEGKIARLAYRFLYWKHQAVLHGWLQVGMLIIAQYLSKRIRPRLKLH